MNLPPYKKPGRVLTVWMVFCVLGGGLLYGADVGLARYADYQREYDYRTYLGYAEGRMALADYAGALTHLNHAKELAPESIEPYAFAGNIHYGLKHWDLAIENLQEAVAHGDTSHFVRLDIVRALMELEDYERAAALGEQFAKQVTENNAILQNAAEAHLRLGQPEKAVPLLELALASTPANLYQLSRLAGAYRTLGEEEKAMQTEARIGAIHERLGELGSRGQ